MENMVEKAIAIAAKAHAGQKSMRGRPYILHPLRVTEQMQSDEEMAVAVLHDVVEDTSVTLDELRSEGFPESVIEAVDLLTHRPSDNYKEYIDRLRDNPLARKVKFADLNDNMRTERIPSEVLQSERGRTSFCRRVARYSEAKAVLAFYDFQHKQQGV